MNDQPEHQTDAEPTPPLPARVGNHNTCLFYWDDPRPGETKAENAARTFLGMATSPEGARLVVDALNVVAEGADTQARHLADLRSMARQMNSLNNQLDHARAELSTYHRALVDALDLADHVEVSDYATTVTAVATLCDRARDQAARLAAAGRDAARATEEAMGARDQAACSAKEARDARDDAARMALESQSARAQLVDALTQLEQVRAELANVGPVEHIGSVEHREFEYALRLPDREEQHIEGFSSLDVINTMMRQAGSPSDTGERYEIIQREVIRTTWVPVDPQSAPPQRHTWEAGSPEPKDAVRRVRAANGVVFRNDLRGTWTAVPPWGDGLTYAWSDVNQEAVTELWTGDPDYPDADQ